jgi:hypothetical protein
MVVLTELVLKSHDRGIGSGLRNSSLKSTTWAKDRFLCQLKVRGSTI